MSSGFDDDGMLGSREKLKRILPVIEKTNYVAANVLLLDWHPDGGAAGNQRAFDRWDRVLRDAGF